MRLAVFDDYRIGVVRDEAVHEVTAALPERWRNTPYAMNELIRNFEAWRSRIEETANIVSGIPIGQLRLRPPVPAPQQILAAPANYRAHQAEMAKRVGEPLVGRPAARDLGFFLKAPGSLAGASDTILLPDRPGREFHHESELAFVIGREARAVKQSQAFDYIFGYTCLIDVTLRITSEFKEERVMRKSFETFTPLGPVLVTADEIADPNTLEVRLWVNDELRQHANTRDMIVAIPELMETATHTLTLKPGDVYATGTPEGVGEIKPGDRVRIAIEHVGEMSLPVARRDW